MKTSYKVLIGVIALAVIISIFFALKGNSTLKGAFYNEPGLLVGSATNLVSLPNVFVEANSTTTDAGASLRDGGTTITQFLNTKGAVGLVLAGKAVGGTATSTCMAQIQVSTDATNWFYVTGSSTSTDSISTSTLSLLPKALAFDPGTATTSFAYTIVIPKTDFTRILFAQENASTDVNDGCQMFAQTSLIKQF